MLDAAGKKPLKSDVTAGALRVRNDISLLTDDDLYWFNEGTHLHLYEKMGSHYLRTAEGEGTYFAVWAPNASSVTLMTDANGWSTSQTHLRAKGSSGIWEGFVEGMQPGAAYKFHIASQYQGYQVDKADPFARCSETPPKTASVVWNADYTWGDGQWMKTRAEHNSLRSPISIYEIHLGSWARIPEEGSRWLTYRELALRLPEYVRDRGFTHVEFLPIMEHPFYGSWGYQTTGYFAPTSRYGSPEDLMYLVDRLHQVGIGVILDWVPSHFPSDEHALAYFDGTHLFEHADPKQGFHPDWNSYIFNYSRNEVRSFLLSSASFWLDKFHADGLRVDAVASMLYLDYSRKEGEWIPNRFGGRENLEAVSFLRKLNEAAYGSHPDIQIIAEESTAWPMVSRPVYIGGLGFGLKWDMGWMHDTLRFMHLDPIYRKYHQNDLTFRGLYSFTENFVLPLSHDEVVHGKGSLLGKMPGDDWQKFANSRLLYAWMFAQSGKKLLFMGGEFGQWHEWNHDSSLDWDLLQYAPHRGLRDWLQDLNRTYRSEPALHQLDTDPAGFEWIDCNNWEENTLALFRHGKRREDSILVALNFTPIPRQNYRVGVPEAGRWREILNSDGATYGGAGWGNLGEVEAAPVNAHGHPYSLSLTLPPLGAIFLKHAG
ncbi:MAG TPA: 1,4-alpha-glucan branching protein GlgB [Candidatus Eisenbacteria bacterium]|nr:1,4-alpha-glucan branching protein GlgB [Candidatus Eisenbacteria bacterium]